ncbi:hypothetical protein LSH36_644g00007 [Paralvinella palmiformis]|uniref:Sushi domain-containing protein n=1 Tax=Paralvinella palmiformis TaxID=53620 RepID=A0AAD9J3Y8_9ANNE|nr:hypothetical protein LSH36_644g00007 [Paralvinella palmiformis]
MPEDPGNATLLDRTGLSINDTILYQCPYGYQIREYLTWVTLIRLSVVASLISLPLASALNCSDIYPDTKAISQLSDVSIGAVMHVVCDPGYRVFGLKTDNFNTTCELDKTGTDADWCWIPPCEEIICPEPDVVAMATYVMNGNELGDNVTYTCETNYKISNTSTNVTDAICGYDEDFQGVWIGVPTCEEIICPDLPTLSNAFIEALPTNTRIGDATVYQCVDNCSAYLDGVQLRFTKTFNVTCRVDDDHFTAVWIANYTCDGRSIYTCRWNVDIFTASVAHTPAG